uniref:cytochrome P450 2B1-like n=1 Tax=Jaculus jaculus TaxID=51337 RepID=UPI001E1B50B0|nr:cytochrome P450 2B1-like [Jaculus jaculus]
MSPFADGEQRQGIGTSHTSRTYVDPSTPFHSITANIICSIVFGEHFDYQDPKFLQLLSLLNDTFNILSSFYSQVFELLSSLLKHFPGPHKHMHSNIQELKDFITENVEQHRETLDPSAPRDFIDCFLLRMDKERLAPGTEFTHKNLVHTVLFFAGTKTSSTTLCYALLLFLKHPEVLEKVQAEIDRVIGRHRLSSLDDRARMPYADAVIYEVQRFSDLTPIGVPHRVLEDTDFRGYHIPKDTDVYPLLGSVLRDPKYFRYPHAFNPQHFLDEQGCFKKNDIFAVASSGKRICVGEALARMELFLYFTSILQNFSLRPLVPPADIDITPRISGFGNIPPNYELCLVGR